MSTSPVTNAYVMSNSQLNTLWQYDMWLAHILMDLPLRSCSAEPCDLGQDFPAMKSGDFQHLLKQVRNMWIFASHHFFCKQGTYGWGLYFLKDGNTGPQPFTVNKTATMGWLAKVPSPEMCPTGHRYLRSPCKDANSSIYLGGPISLANFDQVDRVTCRRTISCNEPSRFKIVVSKAPGRKITSGSEVLWTYCLNASSKLDPKFFHITEWQKELCCSEVEKNFVSSALTSIHSVAASRLSATEPGSEDEDGESVKTKKRKMGGPQPKTSVNCIQNFKHCTYCGKNLALDLTPGKRDNMKRHWALKHAVDVCNEMGFEADDFQNPVNAKDFIKHLDTITNVYNSLKEHCYKIVPACNFFEITGTAKLNSEATESERDEVFTAFLDEGKSAFKKYQVLYLKGISVPEHYEDLLPSNESNYSNINWRGSRPSSNNFSLNKYNLDEEEAGEHANNIKTQLASVVIAWFSK